MGGAVRRCVRQVLNRLARSRHKEGACRASGGGRLAAGNAVGACLADGALHAGCFLQLGPMFALVIRLGRFLCHSPASKRKIVYKSVLEFTACSEDRENKSHHDLAGSQINFGIAVASAYRRCCCLTNVSEVSGEGHTAAHSCQNHAQQQTTTAVLLSTASDHSSRPLSAAAWRRRDWTWICSSVRLPPETWQRCPRCT
jgi:hypothetical protein